MGCPRVPGAWLGHSPTVSPSLRPPSALTPPPASLHSIPPAIPPFCPLPRPLPGPAVPPAPNLCTPAGPWRARAFGKGGRRLCRGDGGGLARPGSARPWHGSPGSPLSREAANNYREDRGKEPGPGPRGAERRPRSPRAAAHTPRLRTLRINSPAASENPAAPQQQHRPRSTGKADAASLVLIVLDKKKKIRRGSTNGNRGRLRIRCKGGNKEDTGDISAGEKSLKFPRVLGKTGIFWHLI